MIITGTSYFATLDAAISYYWTQSGNETKVGHDEAVKAVNTKLKEKSIHIGFPPVKKGQQVKLNLMEGRYFIYER